MFVRSRVAAAALVLSVLLHPRRAEAAETRYQFVGSDHVRVNRVVQQGDAVFIELGGTTPELDCNKLNLQGENAFLFANPDTQGSPSAVSRVASVALMAMALDRDVEVQYVYDGGLTSVPYASINGGQSMRCWIEYITLL